MIEDKCIIITINNYYYFLLLVLSSFFIKCCLIKQDVKFAKGTVMFCLFLLQSN